MLTQHSHRFYFLKVKILHCYQMNNYLARVVCDYFILSAQALFTCLFYCFITSISTSGPLNVPNMTLVDNLGEFGLILQQTRR